MVTKKQKEKRKDFQKQKLKVGKAKPQATTQTNVNFVSKSIHLKQQSIIADLSAEAELNKYLSLCKHHASNVRKESVVYIQQHLSEARNVKNIIATVAPLVRDASQSVRDALLELMKSIDPEVLRPNSSLVMLHVHSAMTHLTPEIRAQSTQFLDLLVEIAPHEVSRLAFARTLSCFFPLLGWQTDEKASKLDQSITLAASTATTGLSYGSKASKTKLAHIQSLDNLIKTALSPDSESSSSNFMCKGSIFHPDSKQFLVPQTTGHFLHLELFVSAEDKSSSTAVSITEDVSDRIALLKNYASTLKRGLEQTVKDSGQIGRTAGQLLEYLGQYLE